MCPNSQKGQVPYVPRFHLSIYYRNLSRLCLPVGIGAWYYTQPHQISHLPTPIKEPENNQTLDFEYKIYYLIEVNQKVSVMIVNFVMSFVNYTILTAICGTLARIIFYAVKYKGH
jgi:hypothetical protein